MKLLAILVAMLAAVPAFADSRAWNFRVFLDDKEIGLHTFTLRGAGDARELRSEANFHVRLLGFTAYRYAHDATERWRGDCLLALNSQTDDNGERAAVDWREQGAGCALSFAYWNPKILRDGQLLNAQTGRFEPVTVTLLGEESIPVRGRQVLSQHYRLTSPRLAIDLWYAAQEWVALESVASGGRRLRYRLL